MHLQELLGAGETRRAWPQSPARPSAADVYTASCQTDLLHRAFVVHLQELLGAGEQGRPGHNRLPGHQLRRVRLPVPPCSQGLFQTAAARSLPVLGHCPARVISPTFWCSTFNGGPSVLQRCSYLFCPPLCIADTVESRHSTLRRGLAEKSETDVPVLARSPSRHARTLQATYAVCNLRCLAVSLSKKS